MNIVARFCFCRILQDGFILIPEELKCSQHIWCYYYLVFLAPTCCPSPSFLLPLMVVIVSRKTFIVLRYRRERTSGRGGPNVIFLLQPR